MSNIGFNQNAHGTHGPSGSRGPQGSSSGTGGVRNNNHVLADSVFSHKHSRVRDHHSHHRADDRGYRGPSINYGGVPDEDNHKKSGFGALLGLGAATLGIGALALFAKKKSAAPPTAQTQPNAQQPPADPAATTSQAASPASGASASVNPYTPGGPNAQIVSKTLASIETPLPAAAPAPTTPAETALPAAPAAPATPAETVGPPATPAAATPSTPITYTVKSGDTLGGITNNQYGTGKVQEADIAALAKLNKSNLKQTNGAYNLDLIQPGQKFTMPDNLDSLKQEAANMGKQSFTYIYHGVRHTVNT